MVNNVPKWSYDYDENGNTAYVKDEDTDALTSFTYDKTDKLKTVTSGKQFVEYFYKPTDILERIEVNSNGSLFNQSFEFYDDGNLEHVALNGSNQAAFYYYGTGLREQLHYDNKVHTNYYYDDAQQLENQIRCCLLFVRCMGQYFTTKRFHGN